MPVSGVPGGSPPYAITTHGLAAIVSDVDEAEYAAPTLDQRLADGPWINARAKAHESVMDAVLRQAALVPAAAVSLLYDRAQALAYLEENFDKLDVLLDYFHNREEWIVRLLFERRGEAPGGALRMVVPLGQARPLPVPTALRGNEREQRIISACHEICHTLRMCSAGFATRQLSFQTPGSDEVLIVGNWAFLVDRGRLDDFQTAIQRLRADYTGMGFEARLSGPFPPFSFSLAPPTEVGFALAQSIPALTTQAQPLIPASRPSAMLR